ncbi:hypothetical protein PCE1_002978 [Barthelona sp. PCE]
MDDNVEFSALKGAVEGSTSKLAANENNEFMTTDFTEDHKPVNRRHTRSRRTTNEMLQDSDDEDKDDIEVADESLRRARLLMCDEGRAKGLRACSTCGLVLQEKQTKDLNNCPACGDQSLWTPDFKGAVGILDPKRSFIIKKFRTLHTVRSGAIHTPIVHHQ